MGRSGVSHHIRGAHPAGRLSVLSYQCAWLGSNRSWTTFAVLDTDDIDASAICRTLHAAVVQIGSLDEFGTTATFFAPDEWSAQFSVTVDESRLSAEDRRLCEELVRRRFITAKQQERLLMKLQLDAIDRATWLASDGLEHLFGVPEPTPLPMPCSVDLLAMLVPSATVIPKNQVKSAAAKSKVAAKPKRALIETTQVVPIDRNVLALHVHYWTEIFQMNGWKLYNRYKKHLPADRRREVDELCHLIALGNDREQIERTVEDILASVWGADDWSAAIRDPRLADDEPLDPDQRADWQRRLAVT